MLAGLVIAYSACAADALDILAGARLPANSAIEWCSTPVSVTIESINRDGCALQPLIEHQTNRGFDQHAFWMKLILRNPGSVAVERWITVGHPRLTELSLFTPNLLQWTRHDVGNLMPMMARGDVERDFSVLPVTLAAFSEESLWLRVRSDSAIDLTTTVWHPTYYRRYHEEVQFWSALGLGGMLITIILALSMSVMNRQATYAFFALAMCAYVFNTSLLSGHLQSFIWPSDSPLRSETIAVSVLFGVLGYYGFIHSYLAYDSGYRRIYYLFNALLLITIILLLLAIFFDYSRLTKLWSLSLLLFNSVIMLIIYQAWRNGNRSAIFVLMALVINFILVAIRLLFMLGWLIWEPKVSEIIPWLQSLCAPIILIGLMDRTRQLELELTRTLAENTTQLTFFAQMSHELRSPLDTILGNAQLLARTSHSIAISNSLSNIFDSGRHLLRMIDHILDYSRGLAGMLEHSPEPNKFSAFLRTVERTGQLYASRQNNCFTLQQTNQSQDIENLILLLDADHLLQVLDNLLANAARHTQNGVISIDYKITQSINNQLRLDFSVSDTGEGVSEADQQRIFKAFERGSRLTGYHKDKGVGLGLSIARQLIELMGGELSIYSASEHGANFCFWVLTKALPSHTETPSEQSDILMAVGYDGRRRRVLIIDDDVSNRLVMSTLLFKLGFSVFQAASGHQAANCLKQLPSLDLVITDQFMPDGDGWMVLETVGNKHPEVPVILISSAPPYPPPHYPHYCRFAASFLKPLDHGVLLRCIGDLLTLTWNTTNHHENAYSSMVNIPRELMVPALTPNETELEVLVTLLDTGQITAIKEWAQALMAYYPEYANQVLSAVQELNLDALKILAEHRVRQNF